VRIDLTRGPKVMIQKRMDEANKGRRKELLISLVVQALKPNSFQRKPFFPDLLNQPDLLIVPEPGKLVAVFLYISSSRLSWKFSIAVLEDLFETKLFVGPHSISIGILLPESVEVSPQEDTIRLLRNTFDEFLIVDFFKSQLTKEKLAPLLAEATPRSDLFYLWKAERAQVSSGLKRFAEDKYRHLIDKQYGPSQERTYSDESIARTIERAFGQQPIKEFLVPNVKAFLGRLPRNYAFAFDFGIADYPNVAIDCIRSERYGSRQTIRYLMAKARLLRYSIENDRLLPRPITFSPILLVDGNIAGPDHDPYRYVRALLSAGWEILRADRVEELPQLIRHADIQG
jgi:hypothetical protein